MNGNWIQLMRIGYREISRDKNAFALLALIAVQARRMLGGKDGLRVGEAIVSNYADAGLTEGEFRAACSRLEKRGLVKFESRYVPLTTDIATKGKKAFTTH